MRAKLYDGNFCIMEALRVADDAEFVSFPDKEGRDEIEVPTEEEGKAEIIKATVYDLGYVQDGVGYFFKREYMNRNTNKH